MPIFVDKKPSVFNFDPPTTYKNSERLDIYLITEKVNNSLRPKNKLFLKIFPSLINLLIISTLDKK